MKQNCVVWLSLLSLFLAAEYMTAVEGAINKDLLLTRSQKLALDKFKNRILSSGILTQNYMKEDIYLIMWLRATEFNVAQAEQMLRADMKWRKANKVDTILDEDWSEMQERFPFYTDTRAKDGKPVLSGSFGEWDLRAMIVTGRTSYMMRYITATMEQAASVVRKLQSEGKNVTRGEFFVNMENYNIVQQGCAQCVNFYIHLISNYQNHYPGYIENIMLVKTPPVFEGILKTIKPLLNPMTKNALKIYGQNKSQWRKALLEICDNSQLAPEFGGSFRRIE